VATAMSAHVPLYGVLVLGRRAPMRRNGSSTGGKPMVGPRRPFCLAATPGTCPRVSSAPCSARHESAAALAGNGPIAASLAANPERVRVLRHCAAALAVLAMDFASGHGKTPSMPGYHIDGWLRGSETTNS
jgi:hypothetical protein